ncbi:MAG: helix-turn-helix transcriptional regulator [Alistipes sp.]|nr:helix-turn-helix transcriptional regulator [Alistipes sp.]
MKSEGLKPSQLADMLGINPAGISHILAGRNKPGFDLLQKILRRFPRISPDWLLLDDGPMYRNSDDAAARPAAGKEPAVVRTDIAEQNFMPGELFASNPASAASASEIKTTAPTAEMVPPKQTPNRSGNNSATVKRIVVLYDDDTFEAYFPTVR